MGVLTSFFIWLINFIISMLSSAASYLGPIFDFLKNGAIKVVDGFMDWLSDPEVDIKEKAGAVLGIGYVLAPDTTSEVVSRVGEGVSDIANVAVDAADSIAGGIFKSDYIKWILIGFGIYLIIKD